jgi:mycothiol synthase
MLNSIAIQENFLVRVPTLDDLAAVVDLMNLCDWAVLGQADENIEEAGAAWQLLNAANDQRIIVTPDGRIVGYVEVDDIHRQMYPFVDAYVHPDFEQQLIGDWLMHWGEERARQAIANVPDDVRVAMRAASFSNHLAYKALLESAGMQVIRQSWRMAIDLDAPPQQPEWPQGITVRSFVVNQDERETFHVQREAFRDHWGFVEKPVEEAFALWERENEGKGFDPSLWFLAVENNQIVGVSLCEPRHGDDAEMGWVNKLSVLRSHRRKGLGMALLLHSFNEFYKRGKKRAGLGVDSSNLTGAVRLYQRAGMHISQRVDLYEKELRAGRELSTQAVTD